MCWGLSAFLENDLEFYAIFNDPTSMQWYYVKEGKQMGPLTQEGFEIAVGSGEIRDDTLVWNETMQDWAKCSTVWTSGLSLKDPHAPAQDEQPVSAQDIISSAANGTNPQSKVSRSAGSQTKMPKMTTRGLRGYGTGQGIDLLLLYLKNFLLTVITFGIYSFWAKVALQKFWHENTQILESEFEYHATGLEKLKAFLKVAVVGGILFGAFIFITANVSPEVQVIVEFTVVGIFLIGAILLRPFIEVGIRAFFLGRTTWNGVHFSFRGRVLDLVKIDCIGAILTILTLGIYTPWYLNKRESFFTGRTFFGTEAFSFSGSGTEYAKLYYVNLILSILTLGIYTPWAIASFHRFKWNNTSVGDTRLQSDLMGMELFKHFLVSFILSILTFGIYGYWALVNYHSITVGSISFESQPDMTRVKAMRDMGASAIAEALTEMGEAVEAVGEVFS